MRRNLCGAGLFLTFSMFIISCVGEIPEEEVHSSGKKDQHEETIIDDDADQELPDQNPLEDELNHDSIDPGEELDSENADDDLEIDEDNTEREPSFYFSEKGKISFTESDGEFQATCNMEYRLFKPATSSIAPTVILTHGFARRAKYFYDFARHIASYGITVYTPNMCHSDPVRGIDHVSDSEDLIKFAESIGGRIIFIGHSAGGLRSVLAGAEYSDTLGVFGLDLVDSGGLAQNKAEETGIKLYGLAGEPSSCNDENNGFPVYDYNDNNMLFKVIEADHCSFEMPTNTLCTMMCNHKKNLFTEESIEQVIKGFTTAFVLWKAGVDAIGRFWWEEGGMELEWFLNSGEVERL